jgi:putative heme-binding domain-containing protein
LVERQEKSVTDDLIKLVTDQGVDEIGLNVGAIHALWTLKGLGALDGTNGEALSAAVSALKHPSGGVRRNAVQVLPPGAETLRTILNSNLLADPDAQVRLMTLLAIADQPTHPELSERAGAAVYTALKQIENITDRWIPDAAVAAAARHDAAFLRQALAQSPKQKGSQPTSQARTDAAASMQMRNLITNGSFEDIRGDAPAAWSPRTYGGEADFTFDVTGRTGRSVKISSRSGGDAAWSQRVRLKPATRYQLSAWVKTRDVGSRGAGALFNVHQLQRQGTPKPLKGSNDWTKLTAEFATSDYTDVTVNLLFGGWGTATGEAWWDDVQLIELGRGESLAGPGGAAGKLQQVIRVVTRHYADRAPADSIVATLAAVRGADADLAGSILDGLAAGWPEGTGNAPKLSEDERALLVALAEALAPSQRDRLLVLAARWGQADIFAAQMGDVLKTVETTLASSSASAADRADAAKRMIQLRDDAATIKTVLAQITPQASSELAQALILTLADSRLDATGQQLLMKWPSLGPAARTAAVSVLLRRAPWTDALLKGVQQKRVARNDLSASDWQVLKAHHDPKIARLARDLDVNTTNADRQKIVESLLPAAAKPGDLAVGQQLFTARCAQCHTFNGQGGKLGPDLTGIGVRDPKDILAEIIDPNRSVEANFRMWNVETKDGDSIAGRLDAETQTTVELLDATSRRHVVQRRDIRRMNISNFSMMPTGLIDTLKQEEVSALLQYLKTGRPTAESSRRANSH